MLPWPVVPGNGIKLSLAWSSAAFTVCQGRTWGLRRGAAAAMPFEVRAGVQTLPLEKGPISSFAGRLTGICILEIDLEYLLRTFHASWWRITLFRAHSALGHVALPSRGPRFCHSRAEKGAAPPSVAEAGPWLREAEYVALLPLKK